MRKLPVVVAAVSVAALGLVAACGAQRAAVEREHTNIAAAIDHNTLNQALIPLDQVRAATGRTDASDLQEVGTLADDIHPSGGAVAGAPDSGGSAELGQAQPLPGVTWTPSECSQMIEAAVLDFTKVDGFTRLFATNQVNDFAAGGVRDGLAANAVLTTPADNVDFERVRAKIERCKSATVSLDTFGVVGKLTSEEIASPRVDGVDRIISWRQSVVFDKLPAEAAGLAALFNAEAVYMTKGDIIVWTSHGGSAGVTAAQLAEPAFRHAMSVLGIK
jgi:hypothetical protein